MAGRWVTTNGASLVVGMSGTLDGVTVNGVLDVGNSVNGAQPDGDGRVDVERDGAGGQPDQQ